MKLYQLSSLSIGTLDKNTAKGQNGLSALKRAQDYYKDFYASNFVIINVEGYDCIAHIQKPSDYLDETIFPYDKDRQYPIQGLRIEYSFQRFY